MPVAQTSYNERMAPAYAGLVKQLEDSKTGICETVAGIGFGLAVSQGVGDQGVVLGGTRVGFLGATIRDVTLDVRRLDKYAQYDSLGMLTQGEIWVAPLGAVVANGPVYFVAATGQFTSTSGGNQGPINGARWKTSAAGDGDFAVLQLAGYNRSA